MTDGPARVRRDFPERRKLGTPPRRCQTAPACPTFDRHFVLGNSPDTGPRVQGRNKGGRYGYPWLHLRASAAFAIYSVDKEDIALLTFPVEELK